MDFTAETVSRNLATTSNFVEFRDSRNFTLFETPKVVRDTCDLVCLGEGWTIHVTFCAVCVAWAVQDEFPKLLISTSVLFWCYCFR